MRAELVLMGRRVDMARQARRRALVVLVYAGMAALMTGMWFADHWRHTGTYVYLAGLLACRLFLGGYYRSGLVKPFNNKVPRHVDAAPSPLAIGLRVYNPLPEDDRSYLNDERELGQRDRAHYKAYQVIAVAILIPWILAYSQILRPGWMQGLGLPAAHVYYGLTLGILFLVFSLPQAILLWGEPDMEAD